MAQSQTTAMWDEWKHFQVTPSLIRQRVETICSSLGWHDAIATLLEKKIPFDGLKVAELGCGTGTFSLCFALLGADVTLVDTSEDALKVAEAFFCACGLDAHYRQVDILKGLPSDMLGRYDLVTSGGLIEHFTADDRLLSIRQHGRLLSPRGFTMMAVPNRYSPFYRMIRWYRERTRTWSMDVEVPYSRGELLRLAKTAGLSRLRVLGNRLLGYDALDYAKGFVSATLDFLPQSVREHMHALRSRGSRGGDKAAPYCHLSQVVEKSVASIRSHGRNRKLDAPAKDFFGATLFLIGGPAGEHRASEPLRGPS